MRGLGAILLDIIFPLAMVALAMSVAVGEIRQRRKMSATEREGESLIVKPTSIFGFLFVMVWCALFLGHIGGKACFKYQLWRLRPGDVKEIDVGARQFTSQESIARIVADLNATEWYAVNHGGWGDETRIVIIPTSGERWSMEAGYHFSQNGAVLSRSAHGWNMGEMFSDRLPGTLSSLGVPLSMCDTAHGRPCPH